MALPQQSVVVPRRGWRIDQTRALAAAAVCWVGFAVMVWLVTTDRTRLLDSAGLLFWRGDPPLLAPRGPELLLEGVRDLTSLGGVLLRHMLALAAIVALLFLRLRREAILLALTIVSGWLVNSAIKWLVGRPRPEIVPHLTEAGGASFPSGHSFNAAVMFIAIALAFATMSARQSVRITIIAAAIVLSLLVSGSRVWLGVHFPSDVIAGWLGGAGWAFLAAAVLRPTARAATEKVEEVTAA